MLSYVISKLVSFEVNQALLLLNVKLVLFKLFLLYVLLLFLH